MRRSPLVFFVLAAVSVPLPALADAVPSPPENCPPGSYGETSHSGQWCQPSTCKTDDDCKSLDNHWARKKSGPHVCRSQPLCILHTKVRPGGRGGFRNPNPIDREVAQSDCNKGCTGVATCERVKRCVVTNTPATPEEPQGDGKDASVVSVPTASPDAAPIDVKVVDPPPPSSSGTASPPAPTGARGCGCGVARGDVGLGVVGAAALAIVTVFRRKRRR